MNARRMMAKITTTSQKKNTTIPGMAYPATDLALATGLSYPGGTDLFGGKRRFLTADDRGRPRPMAARLAVAPASAVAPAEAE
jgi:hypothetical protein